MKKETKQKIKNVTIEIIDFFLGIPESVVNGFDRNEFYRLMQGHSGEKELTCSNIAKFITNLKNRGYIEIQATSNNSESIIFTNKARLAIIDRLIKRTKNDNKYCFVSFDIPEDMRINRDQFRRTIKRMGFVQVQKSLWVIDKNVGEYVEMAAEEYSVNEYVVYLVTEATNIDTLLPKMLKHIKP